MRKIFQGNMSKYMSVYSIKRCAKLYKGKPTKIVNEKS